MVRIVLENLGKRYGSFWAIRNINLEIADGELFVLLGPSGCGKTTLLKTIAGLLLPDEGEIYFDDKSVTTIPPWERNIGFVFQNPALFPHMTVYENVALPLETRGIKGSEVKKRVMEVLDLLDIAELKDRYPREISGGQQQRVAIARALIIEPQVLLLDEPFSNLDALIRDKLRWLIKKLHAEFKITTLFVTHDQLEAFQLADRIGVMDFGKLVQIGAPMEIYNNPKDAFVAKFVKNNVIKAIYLGRNNGSFLFKIGEHIISIPRDSVELVNELKENEDALIVVKPEDIQFLSGGIPVKILTWGFQKNYWKAILKIDGTEIEAIVNDMRMPNERELRVKFNRVIVFRGGGHGTVC